MNHLPRWTSLGLLSVFALCQMAPAAGKNLDVVLQQENREQKIELKPAEVVDDLTFLRRVSTDLIGRIPTLEEIREFRSWPADERREKVVEKLIAHDRFADRWTTFYADMVRARTNADGGAALIAYLNRSIKEGMPHDELARRLIITNGRAGRTPEAGFVLGDNADPLALASSTSQVFMGVRMGCAQCHDHPFDVWKREDFYGLAAYYGKTRRVQTNLTRIIYTTETQQTTVLWPPEDESEDRERTAMKARFPIELEKGDGPSKHIARLEEYRRQQALAAARAGKSAEEAGLDDLLAKSDAKISQALGKVKLDAVTSDAKRDLRKINIQAGLYGRSELREQLAKYVTSPRNRYFSRAFVNRVWADLVGRGFVEPIDDFREDNQPSHPETLDFLADEFVASGFSLRHLVRTIVNSDVYQRAHVDGQDDQLQMQMEESFLATPMRRVLSEAIYDSVVVAGHLFDVKHGAGQNKKTYYETVRVRVDEEGSKKTGEDAKPADLLAKANTAPAGKQMAMRPNTGYAVESAIELDFDAVLAESDEEVALDEMRVMSKEELEAMRMRQSPEMMRGKYIEKQVKRVYDDNPKFASSFRMASPAPAGHFLRVFGQSARAQLGDLRDRTPSMRQALLMLNGRLTNEASRVGPLEPMHKLLVGKKASVKKAVQLAYLEILTRLPTETELGEGQEIVADGEDSLAGMQDLRWILLNCNEFRYLR